MAAAQAQTKTAKKTSSKNGNTPKVAKTVVAYLGLSQEVIDGVVKIMQGVLADEFTLYTKLRKYHWNVTGAYFHALHASFETQYAALEAVIDEAAERIRQYGALSIGTLEEFKQHARLIEQPGVNPDARQMVEDIATDHETMVRRLRDDVETIDDQYDDISAEDYLTGLMHVHEKFAWMMRAMLAGSIW